jgi:hypothetical protein
MKKDVPKGASKPTYAVEGRQRPVPMGAAQRTGIVVNGQSWNGPPTLYRSTYEPLQNRMPKNPQRVTDPYARNEPLDYNNTPLIDYPGGMVGIKPGQGDIVYDQYGNIVSFVPMGNKANTDRALAGYESADFDTVLAVQKRLTDAGLLSGSAYVPGRFDAATKSALYVAMQEGNRNRMSWMQYADDLAGVEDASGSGSGRRGSSGADYPITTTNTQFSYTAKNKARLLIEQAVQEALGRAPTRNEMRQFVKELRQEEEANPSITTTTTDAEGNVTQEFEPGLEAEAWLSDVYIEDVKPGQQQRYKRAQYENLLMSMMGNGGL